MPLPVVAIVGRPNVGKSSLFNALVGRRVSIVDPTAGVTRDRISTIVEFAGRYFELTDTGGIGIVDVDQLTADVDKQIQAALDQASVILFVVDARTGPVPLDQLVAERLRVMTTPIICVVNKCDDDKWEEQATEFHRLGYQPVIPVSAAQKRNRDKLRDAIVERLPAPDEGGEVPPEEVHLKLAIVGRRNSGKSTFINELTQAERVIVSEIPGTTRDSVDVRFERDGKTFVAIDTAGVRNKSSLANSVEFYSMSRAERSIRRADVVLHFFDASIAIGRLDKQLYEYILENHKPAIFVMNKWDLVKDEVSTEKFGVYVKKVFPMLDYVPIAFVTAKDGKNVFKLLNLAQQLVKQAQRRITTGELNRVLRMALEANPPSQKGHRLPKIIYATQIAISPPTIALFCNRPELFDDLYRRYLLKVFREHLPYPEVPINLDFRSRRRSAKGTDDLPDGDDDASAPVEEKKQPAPGKAAKAKKKGPARGKPELWDV